jgi:hypothetical protein
VSNSEDVHVDDVAMGNIVITSMVQHFDKIFPTESMKVQQYDDKLERVRWSVCWRVLERAGENREERGERRGERALVLLWILMK